MTRGLHLRHQPGARETILVVSTPMRVGIKLLLVAAAVMVAGVVIGFYVSDLTTLAGSPAYSVPVQNVNGHPVVNLELQTVAAVGPQLSQNPDWVSYLIKDAQTG